MENEKLIGKDYSLVQLLKMASSPMLTQMMLSLLSSLDDSLFISRYLGADALASFSIGSPVIMTLNAICMLVAGASTLCSAKMGEKRTEEARRNFTSMAIFCIVFGIAVSVLLYFFIDPILRLCGATDNMLPYCRQFWDVMLWNYPLMLLTTLFSAFYVPAGKPSYNMVTTLIQSFCNFFFDWIFIVKLGMGLNGTAFANIIGCAALTVFGLVFFSGKKCEIGFSKVENMDHFFPVLKEVIRIGLPGMLTSLMLAVNSVVINYVLLNVSGEIAVSANSIVNSTQFIFMSAFFGLSRVSTPLESYAYGARDTKKIKKLIYQFAYINVIVAVAIMGLYFVGKNPLESLYFGENSSEELREMVNYGLTVAPAAFLFFGLNIWAQDLFTSMQNSRNATLLSSFENILMSNVTVLILPEIFGVNGFWWTFPATEIITFAFTIIIVIRNANIYGYGKSGKATWFETHPAEKAEAAE